MQQVLLKKLDLANFKKVVKKGGYDELLKKLMIFKLLILAT